MPEATQRVIITRTHTPETAALQQLLLRDAVSVELQPEVQAAKPAGPAGPQHFVLPCSRCSAHCAACTALPLLTPHIQACILQALCKL